MRQVKIKHKNTHEICWVDNHPKLKKGCFITLKDLDNQLWEVVDIWKNDIEKEALYKPWKVGGL